jgi:hypothetical protein
MVMMKVESENNNESISKWFNEVVLNGENSILVYSSLQSFRQVYASYVKDQFVHEGGHEYYKNKGDNNNKQPKKPTIILIAPFYETVESVKHHLAAFGVNDLQSFIDEGSLVTVDSFHSYFPDVWGMKKLVASLSDRARKEGRDGVTAIIDMGPFFLIGGDGKATELIKYEASLAPKTSDNNIRGFSCYHVANYNTLTDGQKEELTQGQKKKLLEVTE